MWGQVMQGLSTSCDCLEKMGNPGVTGQVEGSGALIGYRVGLDQTATRLGGKG